MDTKEELLNYLKMEHLTGDIKVIAELTGLEIARMLLLQMDGLTLHIPSVKLIDDLLVEYLKAKYGKMPIDKKTEVIISNKIGRPVREVRKLLCRI
jgi:hypothetical protein